MAENTVDTVAARIRAALDTLARHGVTEQRVQTQSRLNDELWARVTASHDTDLAGIKTIELVMLAEALMLDASYLLCGDRRYCVRYSPCGVTAMIESRYPAAG